MAAALALTPAAPAQADCGWDPVKLTFAGDERGQALCLLRPVPRGGVPGPPRRALPRTLDRLIGTSPTIDGERLAVLLGAIGLDRAFLDRPVSRANDNAPDAPAARYFVIHDTSSFLKVSAFPADIDTMAAINDLARFAGENAVAHAFVNRTGAVLIGHDFAVPWRATKRERQAGIAAKGLFLHVENVQPRRTDPAGRQGNDAIAPVPGLTAIQYDRLALLYVAASVRAGHWLVPGFHAAVDDGIADAHDDPQNFNLNAFDRAVARLVRRTRGRDVPSAAGGW